MNSKIEDMCESMCKTTVNWVLHPQTVSSDRIIATILTHPPLFIKHKLIVTSEPEHIGNALGTVLPDSIVSNYKDIISPVQKISSLISEIEGMNSSSGNRMIQHLFIFIDSPQDFIQYAPSAFNLNKLNPLVNLIFIIPLTVTTPLNLYNSINNLSTNKILSLKLLNPGANLVYILNKILYDKLEVYIESIIALRYESKHIIITPSENAISPSNISFKNMSLRGKLEEFRSSSVVVCNPNNIPIDCVVSCCHFIGPIKIDQYDKVMKTLYKRSKMSKIVPGYDPITTLTCIFYVDPSSISSIEWYTKLSKIIQERQSQFISWERDSRKIVFDQKYGLSVE